MSCFKYNNGKKQLNLKGAGRFVKLNAPNKISKGNRMKRYGNLYEQICSLENLKLADEKARKNKGKPYGIWLHDKNREENIVKLREMLLSQTYKTSQYDIFKLFTPKERLIFRLPYFPDRITHHAIMNILEPIWCSIFTNDTYACIKGKGIHAAATKLKIELRNNPDETKYCLKIDIKKFYPSINHAILKQIIRQKIKDKRLLWLLDEIIDSAEGVPIGNYLSQYFANLYLAYFDHWMKEQKGVKYYYRYADDMVILGATKNELHLLLHEMRLYLRTTLKLKIKDNYQVFPVSIRGIDFVGYRFYHTHTLLRKSIKKNFARKVAKIMKQEGLTYKYVNHQICSWLGWCKHCDSINLTNKLLKNLPYEIKLKK